MFFPRNLPKNRIAIFVGVFGRTCTQMLWTVRPSGSWWQH